MAPRYKTASHWIYHGETGYVEHTETSEVNVVVDEMVPAQINGMEECLNEVMHQYDSEDDEEPSAHANAHSGRSPEAEQFFKLVEDANSELYPGCTTNLYSDHVLTCYVQMNDSDETLAPSDCDEDVQNVQGSNSEGTSRVAKSRRTTIPDWGLEGPRPLEFNQSGKAVGKGAGKFSRFIGYVARDHSLLPLDCDNWRHMDSTRINIAWHRVKDTILWTEDQKTDENLMDKIKKVVLAQLNDRWKFNKIHYRDTHYTPKIGKPDRMTPPNKSIEPAVWRRAVELWDSAQYKAIRELNKKNAALPRMHHTTGTRSFGQVEHNYETHNGKKVDRLTMLKLCYTRNDGAPINDQAKKTIDAIESVLQLMSEEEQGTLESRNAAFMSVVGDRDRNGRLLGGGIGVRPSVATTGNGSLSNSYIEALTRSVTEKCENDYRERLARSEKEIEERITKNIEEQFKKKMEDDQARREADMQQYLMQMTPEPNWLARALETGYSSQTQGNFQHLLSQNNTQMSHMQMMPHQPYQFHPPIFPRIQPTFELGAPYIPTPPQVENANVNFGANARNKDNGNNHEE